MNPRVEPTGIVKLLSARDGMPFAEIVNGCLVVRVNRHGGYECSVSIDELSRLAALMREGSLRGEIRTANTMAVRGE